MERPLLDSPPNAQALESGYVIDDQVPEPMTSRNHAVARVSDSAHASSRGLSRKAVLWHTGYYATSTYAARAIAAIRSFINARWLGPEIYGFWGSVTFLVSFGMHLHGGVQEIMARDIPAERSKGRFEAAQRTAQLSFTFFFYMLLAAAVAIWIFALRLPAHVPMFTRVGWWVGGFAMLLESLYFFEQRVARAEQRFADVSWGLVIAHIVSLILTCWLVISYGIYGLFVVAVVTPAVGIWYFRRRAEYRWRLNWAWPTIQSMLRAGWPILMMTLSFEALRWVDRILVLRFIGTTGFGYYMLGAVVAQCCFIFPEVMASVIEPRLYSDYAKHQQLSAVREHVWFPLQTLAFIMPAGLAGLHLFLPIVIGRWLPAYVPGVPAICVLIWASFFMGLTVCTKSVIVAMGEQGRVLPLYWLAIAANLAVSFWLVPHGWGLVGIALGTMAAYIVCCTGLLLFVMRRLGWSMQAAMVRIVALYTPAVIMSAITAGLPALMTRMIHRSLGLSWDVAWSVGILTYGVTAGWYLLRWIRSEDHLPQALQVPVASSLVHASSSAELPT